MASSQEGLLTGLSPSLLCHKPVPEQLQCVGWEGSELVIVRTSKVTVGLEFMKRGWRAVQTENIPAYIRTACRKGSV